MVGTQAQQEGIAMSEFGELNIKEYKVGDKIVWKNKAMQEDMAKDGYKGHIVMIVTKVVANSDTERLYALPLNDKREYRNEYIIKAEKARLATPEEILAATNYEFDV